MKRLYLILAFLFLLVGCLPPPQQILPNTPQAYTADFNNVWNAAIDTLDNLGFTPAQMQKEDGFLTTERKTFSSSIYGVAPFIPFARAFGSMSANINPMATIPEQVKVTLRILKDGSTVTVKVNPYIAHSMPNGWEQVQSNGQLENKIQAAITQRLLESLKPKETTSSPSIKTETPATPLPVVDKNP
ncbi:hypothetical protein EPN18_09775 [bacterium]|nr:MAG: hypothetical protein EPN18_09775 [bacterium]